MIKRNLAIAFGIATLTSILAPAASASCGQALAARLSILKPQTDSRARVPDTSVPEAKDSPAPAGPGSRIVGLWETNVLLGGQVIFQSYESFTGDGLEFLNDNGTPIEGNVCFGTWINAPKDSIKVYHPSWNYDMGGNLIGTVVIKSQITIEPGGNTFTGTVVVDTYDVNGKQSGPELQAQITGTRITAK
jgi:hypothetical protein